MSDVKLRYNTQAGPDDPLKWRVLVDGVEHLAEHVVMQGIVRTSTDELPGGLVKHHVSMTDVDVELVEGMAYVTGKQPSFAVSATARGVQFTIGNQGFTLAGTELDDDPEAAGNQEYFMRMLRLALGNLAG